MSTPGRTDARDSPSLSVALRIAEREGVPPEQLAPRLADVIDPEALDSIFAAPSAADGEVRVSFAYHGYDVTVTRSGIDVVAHDAAE